MSLLTESREEQRERRRKERIEQEEREREEEEKKEERRKKRSEGPFIERADANWEATEETYLNYHVRANYYARRAIHEKLEELCDIQRRILNVLTESTSSSRQGGTQSSQKTTAGE